MSSLKHFLVVLPLLLSLTALSQSPSVFIGLGGLRGATFSPDGQLLASYGNRGVILWNEHHEVVHVLEGHEGSIGQVAFTVDGSKLLVVSGASAVSVWDVATGERLEGLEGHPRGTYSVAASPDGRTVATGGFDDTVKLWDVMTGTLLHTLSVTRISSAPSLSAPMGVG